MPSRLPAALRYSAAKTWDMLLLMHAPSVCAGAVPSAVKHLRPSAACSLHVRSLTLPCNAPPTPAPLL